MSSPLHFINPPKLKSSLEIPQHWRGSHKFIQVTYSTQITTLCMPQKVKDTCFQLLEWYLSKQTNALLSFVQSFNCFMQSCIVSICQKHNTSKSHRKCCYHFIANRLYFDTVIWMFEKLNPLQKCMKWEKWMICNFQAMQGLFQFQFYEKDLRDQMIQDLHRLAPQLE